jgi:hypothetical protein
MAKQIEMRIELVGWSAVHYVESTGVELRIAERRFFPGRVDPAGSLTPEEARDILARNNGFAQDISCTAMLGERPYGGKGPIELDWPALHAAAIVVDAARLPVTPAGPYRYCYERRFGYDGITDAFGGSYFPQHYQERGLAGVCALLAGAQQVRMDAWNALHRSRHEQHGTALARSAIQTALAVDHLFRCFAAIGVHNYNPETEICGVTETMQMTGLRWLRGLLVDDGRPTLAEINAFMAGSAAA